MRRSTALISRRLATAGAACVLTGVLAVSAARQPDGEPDPVVSVAAVLPGTALTGEGYTIADAVRTPASYHVFTVTSAYGTFEAEGRSQVPVRLEEIAALRRIDELSKAGVLARSAGESFVKIGTGVVNVVRAPVETAKGIGGGVKRFGVNLGRRTKRAVQRLADDRRDDKSDDGGSTVGDAAAGAAKSLIGLNGARRRWASRLGADPYTTNPVLKDALERVAAFDVAGGIAASVAVPIPPIVGTTADVGTLVWGTDPEELRKLNESRARDLRASSEGASAFFRNFTFTLTMQTRLIAALTAVNVPGTGDYLASAAEAADEREALFFVESAELLQREHAASPVAAVLTDSRALVARRPAGEVLALLPLDWVRASASTTDEFGELARRAKDELGATSLRLVVTGTVSEPAAAALAAFGWRR